MTTKNILAISGSLKASSANKKILQFIATQLPLNVKYTLYEDLATLPLFNPDVDIPNTISQVDALRQRIQVADVVIFCTPEYAFGVPGALKNALDWLVSSGEMNEKPVIAIAASLGGDKALASLLLTLKALGTQVKADVHIGYVNSKISKEGSIDTATQQLIINAIGKLSVLLS